MDYSKFQSWKNSHATEMQDLTFAKPFDFFIFIRFKENSKYDGKQVLYAENIEEAIGYIRHIFLYDIINDATFDLELDFKRPFNNR